MKFAVGDKVRFTPEAPEPLVEGADGQVSLRDRVGTVARCTRGAYFPYQVDFPGEEDVPVKEHEIELAEEAMYVYRVVDGDGNHLPSADTQAKVYTRKSHATAAKNAANRVSRSYGGEGNFRLQRARLIWEEETE